MPFHIRQVTVAGNCLNRSLSQIMDSPTPSHAQPYATTSPSAGPWTSNPQYSTGPAYPSSMSPAKKGKPPIDQWSKETDITEYACPDCHRPMEDRRPHQRDGIALTGGKTNADWHCCFCGKEVWNTKIDCAACGGRACAYDNRRVRDINPSKNQPLVK